MFRQFVKITQTSFYEFFEEMEDSSKLFDVLTNMNNSLENFQKSSIFLFIDPINYLHYEVELTRHMLVLAVQNNKLSPSIISMSHLKRAIKYNDMRLTDRSRDEILTLLLPIIELITLITTT